MVFLATVFEFIPVLVAILFMSKNELLENQVSKISLLTLGKKLKLYFGPDHRNFNWQTSG